MPPAYVKPFVKRGKTDAADAEAIAEAVTRKAMRFVPVKSAEQQAMAVLVKSRALLVRQRTQAINVLRAHLAEFGIIAGTGMTKVVELIAIVRDESDQRLPAVARQALREIAQQVESLAGQIKRLDRQIVLLSRQDSDTRRLTTIPGVGAIIAASVKAFVPDPSGFKSRPALCRLAWPNAPATLERRQGAAGAHLQDGQSPAALPAGGRRDISAAPCPEQSERTAMDRGALGAPALQGGHRCTGQQDGTHRLGAAGQGRRLSRCCHRAGLIASEHRTIEVGANSAR
jgi:transposase